MIVRASRVAGPRQSVLDLRFVAGIREFDRIVLGRIDEVERGGHRWNVYSHDVAEFPVVFGTSHVAIAAIEASLRRLADAKLIDSMGGSESLPASKQPYGLTAAGVANSIPTTSVLADLTDEEISTRVRTAVDIASVRRPYRGEQESRRNQAVGRGRPAP